MFHYEIKQIPNQKKEIYYGNREYKLKLELFDTKDIPNKSSINQVINNKEKTNKANKRATQMLFRLNEGNGKALYIIGITDDGNTKGICLKEVFRSFINLNLIASLIGAVILKFNIYKGNQGYIATSRIVLPNYIQDNEDLYDI